MAHKDEGSFTNRLYSMDEEALRHVDVLHGMLKESKSKIVRDAVRTYFKVKATELLTVAPQKPQKKA